MATDGFLWVGDWGHDGGGMFGCGNDNYLGIAPTNIRLVTTPPPHCEALRLQGVTTSGVHTLSPFGLRDSAHTVTAYCDMSQTPAGQSLFTVSGGITFGSRSCTLNIGNDDMDSSMMWVDYTGKVETTNGQNVASTSWMTLPRDGTPSSASAQAGLSPMASGVNTFYKPVPFPGVGLVVWFGPSEMRFLGPDSTTTYTISYPSSISANCRPLSSGTNTYNIMIMITDGISSVTMGRRPRSSTTISCLVHVAFDWSASTYDATMLTVTPIANPNTNNQVTNWHDTEQDANDGDLLWTVNGKPAWVRTRATLNTLSCACPARAREHASLQPAQLSPCARVFGAQYSSGRMHLGTGMAANVFQSSSSSAVSVSNGVTQHGLDIFIRVATDGFLWVGDWGHDNGGMFGCGNDNYLGIAPTNIRLARTCPPEFAAAKILYCNGGCNGVDGVNGCQQADADGYCKLHKCCATSVATSWTDLPATNVPGFSCTNYGVNQGNFFGIPNVHTEADVASTHGGGNSITNAVCTPC